MRRILPRFLLTAPLIAVCVLASWSHAPAQAAPSGGLVVKVVGLPPGERPLISVRAPDGRRTRGRADALTLPGATPGDYTMRRARGGWRA